MIIKISIIEIISIMKLEITLDNAKINLGIYTFFIKSPDSIIEYIAVLVAAEKNSKTKRPTITYKGKFSIVVSNNVEKIIVLSNNGKIIEYRDIEHIRSIFIALCHQEYPDSVDAINRIQALKLAYRNEFLDKLGNLSIINIIRGIYASNLY